MEHACQALNLIHEQKLVCIISKGKADSEDASDTAACSTTKHSDDDENKAPVVAAWQYQTAALRSLRSVLSATLAVGDSGKRGEKKTSGALELCCVLWEQHQKSDNEQAVLVPGAEAGPGSLLAALAKVCVDIRSQLSKDALDFVGWFGEHILGPAILEGQEQAPTESAQLQVCPVERAQRKPVLRREVAALREDAQLGSLNLHQCGLRSGANWKRETNIISENPPPAAGTECPSRFVQADQSEKDAHPAPRETGSLPLSVKASSESPAAEILLYLMRAAIFPVLIRTKKVFFDAADECACRMLDALSWSVPRETRIQPVLFFLLKACAGGESHPVLRERCGSYACCLLGINRESEMKAAPSIDPNKSAASALWNSVPVHSEIEATIRIAIKDSQVGVRCIARHLFRALRENLPDKASAIVESLLPEDRRRLVDAAPVPVRPLNIQRVGRGPPRPLGDASQRQNRENKAAAADTRSEHVDAKSPLDESSVICREQKSWIAL
jgi:hypothetical protein